MYQIGQKVVCMRDDWEPRALVHCVCPKKGQEYVIRSISHSSTDNGPFLRFHWLINTKSDDGDEYAFASVAGDTKELIFRPIIERETSIEVFQQIRIDASNKTKIPEKV